jgi:thioredoxin reductase (NADPH)
MAETTRRRPPTILSVDDDPPVLEAIGADLRSRYGASYRVVTASSAADALRVVERLRLRGDALALLVADQRMPGASGTDLIGAAKQSFPGLRSVLLTAYADTDAAITAINEVDLDHYVLKPWHPPEERLYPVLDELLEEWHASRPPLEGGLRLVGDRWSAASHQLRDFLARNLVPFRWVEVGTREADQLVTAAPDGAALPLLVLEDGTTLPDPPLAEVARTLALAGSADVEFHDLVVVGAGPSGLAAAVYAGSEGLSAVVVEAEAPGGQAGLSSRIENYLGFPGGVSGAELTRRAHAQARRFGSVLLAPHRAVGVRRQDPYRAVVLADGRELHCSAVVLATGVQYRRLEAPGVERLTGAGIYYGAASTEAAAMKGERVVVVGGANSAGQAALHLSRFAAEVVVAVRAGTLAEKMSAYLVQRLESTGNMRIVTRARVERVEGDHRLEVVHLASAGGAERLEAAGMFVFVGAQPGTEWLAGDVARDDRGFVLTGPDLRPDLWPLDRDPYLLETSMPAVFAVGDVRAQSVKRIASAVGEGSIAVQFVHQVLRHG